MGVPQSKKKKPCLFLVGFPCFFGRKQGLEGHGKPTGGFPNRGVSKPRGFQTGGFPNRGPGEFPAFFGKCPDCVADPFGTVPRRCCYHGVGSFYLSNSEKLQIGIGIGKFSIINSEELQIGKLLGTDP